MLMVMNLTQASNWFRICLSNTQAELGFAQRDFFAIYDGMCKRTERELDKIALSGHAPAGLLPQMKTVDDAIKGLPE